MTESPVPRTNNPVEAADGVVCPVGPSHRTEQPPLLTKALRDRLVRLAYRFLWNVDDAEDVVHDSLTAAHERHCDLRDSEKWWSWVCRIVIRRCHEHGRRKLRRERHDQTFRLAAAQKEGPPHVPLSEGTEILRRLVLRLPRRQKEVIVLRHLQGMSYDEIAQVLSISPATARVHAQAGREKLRSLVVARHPDWFNDMRSSQGAKT